MSHAVDQCMCRYPVEDDGSSCMYFALGYPWCRSCGEHHRPPECPVDGDGYSLAPSGERWRDLGMPTDGESRPRGNTVPPDLLKRAS